MHALEAWPCCSAKAPLSEQIHRQIHELVDLIMAEVAAIYEQNLVKQVALFAIENQELRERVRAMEGHPTLHPQPHNPGKRR
jgi:hypothetical protein